jgi:hypothetical protein
MGLPPTIVHKPAHASATNGIHSAASMITALEDRGASIGATGASHAGMDARAPSEHRRRSPAAQSPAANSRFYFL